MPPKGSAGKGKAKLTKADKERIKKEEEERRAKEEEEARIRAEEEEKIRIEEERIAAEEAKVRTAYLRKLKNEELDDMRSMVEGLMMTIHNDAVNTRKNYKWERYLKCDGTPDPTIPGEINTYINLWREDDSKQTLPEILEESQLTLELIDELNHVLSETPSDEMNENDLKIHKQTLIDLQHLLMFKLDQASMEILERAIDKADIETQNLQHVVKNNSSLVCIWGNLAKNARLRSHTFDEGVSFEIPRPVATADISIRLIFAHYDHLTYLCRSNYPDRHHKQMPPIPDRVPTPVPDPVPTEETGEVDDDNQDMILMDEKKDQEKDTVTEGGGVIETDAGEKKDGETTDDAIIPPVDDATDEIMTQSVPEIEEDPFLDDPDVINLHQYQPVGPVIYIDVFELPPQPRTAKGWIMKQVIQSELKRLTFMDFLDHSQVSPETTLAATMTVAPSVAPGGNFGMTLPPGFIDQAAKMPDMVPPVRFSFKVPDNVFIHEEPQVARWDFENNIWKVDGIFDASFDPDTRHVSFKTIIFGPFMCVQDAYLNMPYQSWELRPTTISAALFTLVTPQVKLEIQIKDDLCRIFYDEEEDMIRFELKHLAMKWMKPLRLLQLLRRCGVNVLPEHDSDQFVTISDKLTAVEDQAYQQISMTTAGYAYSWSRFNTEEIETNKIVLQNKEHLIDEPIGDDEWRLIMITDDEMWKLAIDETAEEYSDIRANDTEVHFDLFHLMTESGNEEAHERVKTAGHKFVDCVYQLLSATKVITYS